MQAGIMIPAKSMPPMLAMYGQQQQHQHQQLQLQPSESNLEESEARFFGDEDYGFRSGSENGEAPSGDEMNPDQPSKKKKKRYHRHTHHQIQELEGFFKECPHPDDRQRRELGAALGLEPLQVKFWFQNKRTQTKTKNERQTNQLLKSENEKLRNENLRFKEALSCASCPNCGGPSALGEMSFDEQQLRIENSRLRDEIERMACLTPKYMVKSELSNPLFNASTLSRSLFDLAPQQGISGELFGAGELLRSLVGTSEIERPLIIELAVSAMEEFLNMAQLGEPLWFTGFDDIGETLNDEEYARAFLRGNGSIPFGWKIEATRHSAMVMMNPTSIVEILMDVNQWSAVFSSVVSKAVTMEVFSTGVAGNYNGALQAMLAEYHVPSPLVPIRESLFVRYCKHHQDGTWAIVDVSLDSLRPNESLRCRRRPSGCLIQEMPNGYSKVIWVEHVEVDDRSVLAIYKPILNSGVGFGAMRWVAILDRQCERVASSMIRSLPPNDIGVISSVEGRRNLLKLAERMVIGFFGGVTGSAAHQWSNVTGASSEDIKVTSRKCTNDPGKPFGHVINAATSLWLPIAPRRLFDFLRDEASRNEWDILSNNTIIHEVAHIANGRDQGNCVSILRVDGQNKSDIIILQESCFDPTGSYIIYAPVDLVSMNMVLNGGDPEFVALLPSGFAVIPDGTADELEQVKSLLTISFQILVDSPDQKSDLALRSATTVNHLIACTIERIKTALLDQKVQCN